MKHAAKVAAKKALTKMDSPLALVAGVTVGILALGIVVQVLLIVASLFTGKSAAGDRPKRDRKPTPKALEAAPAARAAKKAAPAKKASSKKTTPTKPSPAKKAAPAKKSSSKKSAAKRTPAKKSSSKGLASPRRSSRTPTRKTR
jgi:Na+-transporting methylmalonyl-CoA/oxaloacetate decarboxylase gamma subunit